MRPLLLSLAASAVAGCDLAARKPMPSTDTKVVGRYLIYHVKDPSDPRQPLAVKLDTMLGDICQLAVAPDLVHRPDGFADPAKPVPNNQGGFHGAIYWKYIPTTFAAADAEHNTRRPTGGTR